MAAKNLEEFVKLAAAVIPCMIRDEASDVENLEAIRKTISAICGGMKEHDLFLSP